MFVVLSGSVSISQRDGLGHVVPIVRQGRRQFSAEVGTLSGQPSLVQAVADEDVEALLVPPGQLRALIIAEADLGERLVRALILRRVALIESEHSGPVLIGQPHAPDIVRLQTFLRRNGHPHHVVDVGTDPTGFPTGISGQALAGRAYVQAQKFGAHMLIPAQARSLDCSQRQDDGLLRIHLADGSQLRARTVVAASGARYRRPAVPRLQEFEGRGVWYWASAVEARITHRHALRDVERAAQRHAQVGKVAAHPGALQEHVAGRGGGALEQRPRQHGQPDCRRAPGDVEAACADVSPRAGRGSTDCVGGLPAPCSNAVLDYRINPTRKYPGSRGGILKSSPRSSMPCHPKSKLSDSR